MAAKTSYETPLSMPNLPDMDANLFGGVAGGVFNQNADALNPKLIEPPNAQTGAGNKSPGAQALEQIEKQKAADEKAARQAREQAARDAEVAERAHIQRMNQLERESNKRMRAYEKEKKEREKQLEEKKQQQGGMLGAGLDGLFVMDKAVDNLLKNPEWQGIKSNLQRDDEAELWLDEYRKQFEAQGIPKDRIDNEINVARNKIAADTAAYKKKMSDDGRDPLDLVTSLGKASRNTYRTIGLWTSGLWADSDEEVRKWAQEEQEKIDSINQTYSDRILLDQANYQYLAAKRKERGDEGFFGTIADAWNSDSILSTIIDTAGYTPQAVLTGALAGKAVGALGKMTGATDKIGKALGVLDTAAAAEGAGVTTKIGAKLAGHLMASETAGGMGATGLFAATDAGGGAYDSVMQTPTEKIRANYIRDFGEDNWNSLVKQTGSEENAKSNLAVRASKAAGGWAFAMGSLIGAAGLETTILKAGKVGMRGLSTSTRLMTVGANTLSEAIEEGTTQISQNLGAQKYNDVGTFEGASEMAAIGAIAGMGMSAGTQVAGSVGGKVANHIAPKYNPDALDPSKYVPNGTLDYERYREVFGNQMDNIARMRRKAGDTEDRIASFQQMAFNNVVDSNAEGKATFTPEQWQQFRDYIKQAYGINSNDYATVNDSAIRDAWMSGDIGKMQAYVDADQTGMAQNAMMAFRMKYNIDPQSVPDQSKAFATRLAQALDRQMTLPTDVDTNVRYQQTDGYIRATIVPDTTLTQDDKNALADTLYNLTDANQRRLTDAEQIAKNNSQPGAATNGTNPNNPSQPGGQGTAATNAQPVAGSGAQTSGQTAGAAGATAQNMGNPAAGAAGGYSAESAGNGAARQGNQPGGGQNAAAQAAQNTGGAAQSSHTVAQQGAPAPAGNAGIATASQGIAGQANQTVQSAGQPVTGTAQTAGSGGSAGAATTERNPIRRGDQTVTQKNDVTPAYPQDRITPEYEQIKRLSYDMDVSPTETSKILNYDERYIVILDVNGVAVPFYRSTGKGGKTDVKAGKWYPFFGIGTGDSAVGTRLYWIIKTGGKGTRAHPELNMNDYYGSPSMRKYAGMLDRVYPVDVLSQMTGMPQLRAESTFLRDANGKHIRLASPDPVTGDIYAGELAPNYKAFILRMQELVGGPIANDDVQGIEQRIMDMVARVEQQAPAPAPAPATTQAQAPSAALAPHADMEDVMQVWGGLGTNQRKYFNNDPNELLRLVQAEEGEGATTNAAKGKRGTTQSAMRTIVHEVRNVANDPRRALERIVRAQKQASANSEHIEAFARFLETKDSGIAAANISKLANATATVYGLPANGNKAEYAAKLLLDIGAVDEAILPAVLAIKMRDTKLVNPDTGEVKEWVAAIPGVLDNWKKNNNITLQETRPPVLDDETLLAVATNAISRYAGKEHPDVQAALSTLYKRMTTPEARSSIRAAKGKALLLQNLLAARRAGYDVQEAVTRATEPKTSGRGTDRSADALRLLDNAEQMLQAQETTDAVRAENWLRTTPVDTYRQWVRDYTRRNRANLTDTLRPAETAMQRKATRLTRESNYEQRVVYTDLVADTIADVMQDMARYGEQYALPFVRSRSGVNEQTGAPNLSVNAAKQIAQAAQTVSDALREAWLQGTLSPASATQTARNTSPAPAASPAQVEAPVAPEMQPQEDFELREDSLGAEPVTEEMGDLSDTGETAALEDVAEGIVAADEAARPVQPAKPLNRFQRKQANRFALRAGVAEKQESYGYQPTGKAKAAKKANANKARIRREVQEAARRQQETLEAAKKQRVSEMRSLLGAALRNAPGKQTQRIQDIASENVQTAPQTEADIAAIVATIAEAAGVGEDVVADMAEDIVAADDSIYELADFGTLAVENAVEIMGEENEAYDEAADESRETGAESGTTDTDQQGGSTEDTSAAEEVARGVARRVIRARRTKRRVTRFGGFANQEDAYNALQPYLFRHPQTVEELDSLLQEVADNLGVEASLVGEYLAREWGMRSVDDFSDASTIDALDMVYDALNDIWVYTGEQNATRQIETTKRLTGARSITADRRRLTRQSQELTGALARALQPNLTGGAYAEITRAPAPARLLSPPVAEIVAAFGGETFNLADIIEATENREGDKSPTLGELAPEDNNAPRPVIELTVNGKTHRGRLFRWRDRKGGKNRRHVVFVHDGDAFGMKGWNDKWIDFGNGVTRKRVDSINANEGVQITVLPEQEQTQTQAEPAAAPKKKRGKRADSQQDLFTQGAENATVDNDEVSAGTTDERREDAVGDVSASDERQGDSRQQDEVDDEQRTSESAGEQVPGRSVTDEGENASGEPALAEVPQGIDITAEEAEKISRDILTLEEKAALLATSTEGVGDQNDFIAEALYNYEDALEAYTNAKDSPVLRSALAKMADPNTKKRTQFRQADLFEGSGQQTLESRLTDDERQQLQRIVDEANELLPDEETEYTSESLLADSAFEQSGVFKKLESAAQNFLKKVWNALRNTVAAVSMALAVSLGTNVVISQPAEAATSLTPAAGEVVMTSAAKATLDHINETSDNGGSPFIIADKKAGKLYLMNAEGKVVDTTPALFGRDTSDAARTDRVTGAGKYDLTYNRDQRLPSGYEGSVQSFDTGTNGETFAIHRVIDVKGENRSGRLASATAHDNRITHGCINVPAEFYNQHLDGELGAVLYVLPETANWQGNLYQPTARQAAQGAPTASLQSVQTPGGVMTREQVEAIVAAQTYNPQAHVAPAQDSANSRGVELTPAEWVEALANQPAVTRQPAVATAPARVSGTEYTGQVAFIDPVVVGGVSSNLMEVPFNQHTPAELQASGVWDTQPVTVRASDGTGLSDTAIWLAAVFAGSGYMVHRRASRKRGLRREARKAREEAKRAAMAAENIEASQEAADEAASPVTPAQTQEAAQEQVQENHNNAAEAAREAGTHNPAPANLQAAPQNIEGVFTDREQWIESLARRWAKDPQQYQQLLEMMATFDYRLGEVLSDRAYQQVREGHFDVRRRWTGDQTDEERLGWRQWFMNMAGGATIAFDNMLHKLGSAALGYEADSAIATQALAQVRSKSSGAYARIHKFYIAPLTRKTEMLAQQLRRGRGEVETDTGRLKTVLHILNEGARHQWAQSQAYIDALQEQLLNTHEKIAKLAVGEPVRPAWEETARKLQKEIDERIERLARAQAMFEGREVWDKETPLPGGFTRARLEEVRDKIQQKYGENYQLVADHAQELTEAIKGIRNMAAAAGVITTAELELYNRIGFKEYVPLYAPQEDPRIVDEDLAQVRTSLMDRIMEGLPVQQARSAGLMRDLSQFAREGSTVEAEDAYTNMKVFAMNTAGRIGQQPWLQAVQQLHEGTIGKPYSVAGNLSPQELEAINKDVEGKLPGLIRVRPGREDYLPREIKTKITRDNTRIRPIRAKGINQFGEVVDYHYYFTDRAIQNEVYHNSDVSESTMMQFLRGAGTITRFAARMMTTFKPVWNAYNWVRDSFERISIMLMRPVKDMNGNMVGKWTLSGHYFRHLARLGASIDAQNEIYRYLAQGEVVTELQRTLDEAVALGAINLMTTQTDKHSIMSELKKSHIDRLAENVSRLLGAGANKIGAGRAKQAGVDALEFYVLRLTEVPQVTTALASYMAYKDAGVNQHETANRVRDQFDPMRSRNEVVRNLTTMYPFVRSTLSGHYNLMRTLSEYWQPGERLGTAMYLAGGIAGMLTIMALAAGMLGDDDDGVPKVARLPAAVLMNGVPLKTPFGGVWSAPVGFGLPKLLWGTAANLYKVMHGQASGTDMFRSMVGLVVDNTSPINTASGAAFDENPVGASILSIAPLAAIPLVELATNTKSYTGGKIYNRDTPKGEYDSEQDNFTVPEAYKGLAKWMRKELGIDPRPETLRHLIETFSYGPLKAIPQSLLNDKGEKTLGAQATKGELAGAWVTALGADMAWSPNALNDENRARQMVEEQYPVVTQYGVTLNAHGDAAAQKKQYGISNKSHYQKAELVRAKLLAAGAPPDDAQFVYDTQVYEKDMQDARDELKTAAMEYMAVRKEGRDDAQLRQRVANANAKMQNITQTYLRKQNRHALELQSVY
jgi:hypothetical protein